MDRDATKVAAQHTVTRDHLKTPKAAAIAGMLFSILWVFITSTYILIDNIRRSSGVSAKGMTSSRAVPHGTV
jgi:hypothetical protein